MAMSLPIMLPFPKPIPAQPSVLTFTAKSIIWVSSLTFQNTSKSAPSEEGAKTN